jgi:hypothetical protein
MERLINFTCTYCKEDFTIQPYFSKPRIYTSEDSLAMKEYYTARTVAKAVCPCCGTVNELSCENEIFCDDIIDLAIRRYKRSDAFFEGYHK